MKEIADFLEKLGFICRAYSGNYELWMSQVLYISERELAKNLTIPIIKEILCRRRRELTRTLAATEDEDCRKIMNGECLIPPAPPREERE